MKPIYLDLHIHTSQDPNNLNSQYDLDLLLTNIRKCSGNSEFLISLTDHNTINKNAYVAAVQKGINIILGCELHIEYDSTQAPYHCHMYFNITEINEAVIDSINVKLDALYPNKVVKFGDKNIPHIEKIVQTFDEYDILLLPHGGQSHSTFDCAIPDGSKFDTAMERSIYYNQFDGFTARGNNGLEKTHKYFSKLGINEFINLVTCSDNYTAKDYPCAKASDATPFIPTWMNARPNFSGLRLSLSESSRLHYGTKPEKWAEYIQNIKLENEEISIDVNMTPGLNVVIGGSSSGKTLFVDSIYRKINNNFTGSKYSQFGVENIYINNPSGVLPHYIHQNYIIELITESSGKTIAEIPIIKKIFPGDAEIIQRVRIGLEKLNGDLHSLFEAVKEFELATSELIRIPIISRLILRKETAKNYFKQFLPKQDELDKLELTKTDYEQYTSSLRKIETFFIANTFVKYDQVVFKSLYSDLEYAYKASLFELKIRKIVLKNKDEIDAILRSEDSEQESKRSNYENLLLNVSRFAKALNKFHKTLTTLSAYSIECKTQEIESMGHKLFIDNNFTLSKTVLKDAFNKYLKTEFKIEDFTKITPHDLMDVKFKKQSPKVQDYDDFENRVFSDLEALNKRTYRIVTANGKKFESLSAGWRTSILLDLILGYKGDSAPLIIDQPEDNLATNYINHGLIKAIKSIKNYKQIILVSHNATIPMLGDAQNVIVCTNEETIHIRSDFLEGSIANKTIVDLIAEITDGGKSSIKKRVKKYNLKQFRE